MTAIFISFIHEEQAVAALMSNFLLQVFGYDVDTFRSSDQNAIYAGEEWMARVFEELKTAKVFISMLSPISVGRPWINFEAGAAWMRGAKVIPVLFNGLTVADLPKPYSNLQAVDIGTPEGCYYLAASVARQLGGEQPERPTFSATSGLAVRDPEQDNALASPYKTLAFWIKFILTGPDASTGSTPNSLDDR